MALAAVLLAVALASGPNPTVDLKVKIPYGSMTSRLPRLPKTAFGIAVAKALAKVEQTSRDDFQKQVKDFGKPTGTYTYDYSSEPEFVHTSPSLISVCLLRWQFTGGAHPMTWYRSYNYSWKGGKAVPVQLKDFFAPGTDLSAVVRYPLLEKQMANPNTDWIQDGTIDIAAIDLETFTVGPNGLTFYYDPYALGPYAVGAFQFTLSPKELGASYRGL